MKSIYKKITNIPFSIRFITAKSKDFKRLKTRKLCKNPHQHIVFD